ncbi:MAG: 23S rRNA (guanosine2251-2'-O)-methyltransferase [Gammaproteobacteria bacterium]|jgi:23S rRNA (guanosine2251-2'-O)-methyltransferase
MKENSAEYTRKKSFFDKLLTIYGRKPVLEALEDKSLTIYKLHLSDSNKEGGIISQITELAAQRQIEIAWHDRKSLSRISRNSKQDQGVAADIELKQHLSLDQFLQKDTVKSDFRLIALDRITNPQNLGLIIRSACAGNVDGILLPRKGCASLSPLVIKASVGTLFKATIIHCDELDDALLKIKEHIPSSQIFTLSSHAKESLFNLQTANNPSIFVLGNETEGVSKEISKLSDRQLSIPMNNGVESLNVAITAALISFKA